MNFSFLPNKIKEQIKQVFTDELPISLARSNTTIDGNTGESYILAYKDKIVVFSRNLGENNYSIISGDFGDVGNVAIRKEGSSTFLDTEIKDSKYSLKFSSFEEKNLSPIVEQWQKVTSGGETGAETHVSQDMTQQVDRKTDGVDSSQPYGKISLMEGLAVALMYISSVDGDVDPQEDNYLIYLFQNNKSLLQKALAYYKSHSYDDFLNEINVMNQEQKLCFAANMMELGMIDGVLHRSEMKLIRKFCDQMGVTEDEYDTLKQVLLIKNQLNVLQA